MNTTTRIFWLLALVIFTSGCSTIRTVSLPGDEIIPGKWEDTDQVAGIGDKVTLALRDGSQVTGTIREVTDISVSLRTGKFPVGEEIEDSPDVAAPLTTVPREEILAITKKEGDTGRTVLLVALIGICVAGVASAEGSQGNGQWFDSWEGGIMTH